MTLRISVPSSVADELLLSEDFVRPVGELRGASELALTSIEVMNAGAAVVTLAQSKSAILRLVGALRRWKANDSDAGDCELTLSGPKGNRKLVIGETTLETLSGEILSALEAVGHTGLR